MYQQYWGLDESPFRGGLDVPQFYATAGHEEALARLHFLVDQRRRLGLLTGPAGIGKSLLLEVFAQEIREAGGQVARTSLIGADAHELLWTLAAQFGLNPALAATPFTLWRRLADRLIEGRYERTQMLVLLDDADEADSAVCELVLRLVQLDPHPDSRLTFVLVGGGQGRSRLEPRILEQAELAIRLEPWTLDETRGYVEFALREAARQQPIFNPVAVERLHQLRAGFRWRSSSWPTCRCWPAPDSTSRKSTPTRSTAPLPSWASWLPRRASAAPRALPSTASKRGTDPLPPFGAKRASAGGSRTVSKSLS